MAYFLRFYDPPRRHERRWEAERADVARLWMQLSHMCAQRDAPAAGLNFSISLLLLLFEHFRYRSAFAIDIVEQ